MLLAILMTASVSAFAECTVLDYQEMKDMSAAELKVELCKARKQKLKHILETMESILESSEELTDKRRGASEQCTGQENRIFRVLKQKDDTASEDNKYLEKICPASTFTGKD